MNKPLFIHSTGVETKTETNRKFKPSTEGISIDSYPLQLQNDYVEYVLKNGMHIANSEKAEDASLSYTDTTVGVAKVYFNNSSNIPKNLKPLNTPNASFSVLETNPKLTGNIKVVIDSNENIFIDTFKVNDTLSKKKYRKNAVSYRDYYGKNIMSIFKNVSSDDIYNIPQKYFDITTTATNMSNQYVDIYRSGVSTNTDFLYKENFSVLAPLYIKDILPDFFVVFKVDGLVKSQNSSNIMKYLIENGKQIKCFDLRLNTKLGTYIRNIQKNANKFGDELYVSKITNNSHQLTGISIEKGVVANIYESLSANYVYGESYNVDPSSYGPTYIKDNIEYLNHFSTLFESNKLVSDRLINFEFMFDDNSEEVNQFELNTYYGLYLYANELTSSIYPTSHDNKGYHFNDRTGNETTLSNALDGISNKTDLIYGYTSNEWFRRITSDNDASILKDIIHKPGENILYTDGKKISANEYKSFFTFTVLEPFLPGEHLKVIFYNSKSGGNYWTVIYEIIFSDDSLYKDSIFSNQIVTYNSDYQTESHRISCYIDGSEDISTQISYIYKAFKEISEDNFIISSKSSNAISLCQTNNTDYKDFDVYFQYIGKTSSLENNKLLYFNNYEPKSFVINPLDSSIHGECDIFLPIDFELLGKRVTSICQFVKIESGKTPFEISSSIEKDNTNLTSHLLVSIDSYKESNDNIRTLSQFVLSNVLIENGEKVTEDTSVNVINSFNNTKTNIVLIDSSLTKKAEQIDIYLYKPYYINYVICGMLDVKQLDMAPTEDEFKKYNDNISSKIEKNETTTISPFIPSKFNWIGNNAIDVSNAIQLFLNNKNNSITTGRKINIQKYTSGDSDSNDYRENILNGEISISDFIHVYAEKYNILPVKTYFINNNTVEFIYNRIKYQLYTNNIELVSGKELNNCNIYMCNTINYSAENEWDIFVDKQNKDILILHYINNYTYVDSSVFVFSSTDWGNFSVLKFNIKETINDLEVKGENLTITPTNNIHDISIETNSSIYVILHTKYYTISGDASIKSNTITLSDVIMNSNYYCFDSSNHIDVSCNNNELNRGSVEAPFTCYLLYKSNSTSSAKNVDKTTNNIDASLTLLNDNAGIYIKANDEYSEYTALNALQITEVDLNGNEAKTLYQTMYTPYFYDVFEFSDASLKDIKTSLYNNLQITNIKPLKNVWGVRYTDNSNYCLKINNYTIPNAFTIKDYNALTSSFDDYYYYFTYNNIKETSTIIKGYTSGAIQKTFHNSLGILMKNENYSDIEITSWLNTYMKDNYIYFNVTYNLLNLIMHSSGFEKIWNQNNISNENYQINFIKKTILPMIAINTKNTISVFSKKSNKTSFSNSYISDMVENKNIKAELVNENENIYVKLTPSSIENNIYYIKYNITL